MVSFQSLLPLALLAAYPVYSGAAVPIQTISFSLRGDVGETSPKDAEKVDVYWKASNGTVLTLNRSLTLSKNWTRFTINVPNGVQPENVQVRYLNDRMWVDKNITYDANVILDKNRFLINGQPVRNISRLISAPGYDRYRASGDWVRARVLLQGYFAWQDTYTISMPTDRPSSAVCDDPTASAVCFNLKGDIGMNYPGEQETVALQYDFTNGTRIMVNSSVSLMEEFERFAVPLPRDTSVRRIVIRFLNQRTWTIQEGLQLRRSVSLDPASVRFNRTRPANITQLIRGPVYDGLRNIGDWTNATSVLQGQFTTSGEYHINLPTPPIVDSSACSDPSAFNVYCFSLKGNLGSRMPGEEELVRISYEGMDGKVVLVYDNVPLTSDFQRIAVQSASPYKRVIVRLLNYRQWTVQGEQLTRGLLLDTSSVFFDQDKMNATALIGSSRYDSAKSAKNWTLVNSILSGQFMSGDDYSLFVPVPFPSSDACDDVSINNKVCFMLKGDVGSTLPGEEEKVIVSYELLNGTRQVVFMNLKMSQTPQRIAVTPPAPIKRVVFRLLNDLNVSTQTGIMNRNLMVSQVFMNGSLVRNMSKIIGGPDYDTAKALGDWKRVTALMSGDIQSGRDFHLNVPLPRHDSSVCDDMNVNNAVCFRLRGNMGSALPNEEEKVNIYFENLLGQRTLFLKDYPLTEEFERFGVVAPNNTNIMNVIVELTNARTGSFGSTNYTRLVYFDLPSLKIGNVQVSDVSRRLGGPILDRIYTEGIMAQLRQGQWIYNGQYVIDTSFNVNNLDLCRGNNPTQNVVCFDLAGDIGETIATDTEKVKITWQGSNGQSVQVVNNYKMTKASQKIAVVAPKDVQIVSINVTFLNDRVWTLNKTRMDRNVLLNCTSMTSNGQNVGHIGPYITSDIKDKFLKARDIVRYTAVITGRFYWGGTYTLNIPKPGLPLNSLDLTKPQRVIGMNLRGTVQKYASYQMELLQFVWVDDKNTTGVALDMVPMSSDWRTVAVPIPTSVQLKKLLIKVLNRASCTVPLDKTKLVDPLVELDLNSITVDADTFRDVTPCTDSVFVKEELQVKF